MLKVDKVCKQYGSKNNIVKALDDVSLEIKDGCMTVLAGPSGSGKTTLLNLLGGLDIVTSGNITIDKSDVTKLTQKKLIEFRKKNIGFVFQSYNLIQSLTAYQNVCLSFKINRCFNDTAKEKVKSIMNAVGIWEKRNSFPRELSGGQQQRVAIARAVVFEPKIILADEPTANLDTENALNILRLLKQINEEKSVTIVISSHDQRVIEMVDTKVIMVDGKIKEIL